MPVYATTQDFQTWISPDPLPGNATRLLRSASGLVRSATAGAVYPTTADGVPSQGRTALAFMEATCIQAEAWMLAGVDPAKGVAQLPRLVQSKGADGRTVTYADGGGRAALESLAAGATLVPAALSALSAEGLLSSRIQVDGAAGRDVQAVAYDPTTGVLER